MKTLTKCTLSAAVAAIIATSSAQAAEVVTFDPSLKLTYKNYFFRDENVNSGYERDEWAHGLILDFDTGYVNDAVGAVVTAGAVDGIDTHDSRGNSTNISGDNGLAGFQQAYLKGKYSFGELNLSGNIGVKKRSTELYGNSGSRILAASSTGVDLAAEYAGVNVYATQITAASGRAQSTLSHELSNNNYKENGTGVLDNDGNASEKIDYIRIFGANYSIAGVDLSAEHLESKDYLRKDFLKAAYSLPLAEDMSVDLDARYGRATDDGDLYGDSDYKSSYYNLNATLNAGNGYVGFGFNKTQDGDFDTNTTSGVNDDRFNSSADLWEAYALEDEKAYILSAGYNFADLGLEGLSVDTWYAKGTDAKDVDNFSRRELGAYVSYAFGGDLEGLSLAWLHVTYRASGTAEGSRGTDTPGSIYDENVNRVYLNYTVSVF